MPLMWSNLIYDFNTVVTGLRNAVYSFENVAHGIAHSRGIYLVYMITAFTHALRIDIHITMQGIQLAVLLVCRGVERHVTKVSSYHSTLCGQELATYTVIAYFIFVCRSTHRLELQSFRFVRSPCYSIQDFLAVDYIIAYSKENVKRV